MKKLTVLCVVLASLAAVPNADSDLQPKVLLLAGLGEPDPDAAFAPWAAQFGDTAVIGEPNLKATTISAYSASVKTEIREAYEAAGREKIGVIAHSLAATAVLDAILKDKAIREDIVSRVVLISPLISGIDPEIQDIAGILTFTGMSAKLVASLEKGSNYFAALSTLMKNTVARIEADPTLLDKYPKILIITSKDDGMIPVSTSNAGILPFVSGLKVRLGLRHGRFLQGKRPILSIKNASDPVYKLARLFLEDNDAWDTIGRDVNDKDRAEVVFQVKGTTAWMKKNGESTLIELKKNLSTKRCFVEGLLPARYHVFVDGDDGGEIALGPAAFYTGPAPIPGAQAPSAKLSASPKSGPVPLPVTFDGAGSTDTDGQITKWAWTFGDGGRAEAAAVNHTYQVEGNYTCVLTVTDDDNLTDTTQVLINVTGPNKTPIASFTVSPQQGDVTTTFAFNGTASSDPDGSIASYSWDFGDNQTATGSTAQHKYATNGTYTAVLTVKDNKGASDTESAQVKVSAQNQPPTAILSALSGGSENPLKVVVVLNATDSDGNVVSATLDFGDGSSGAITPGVAYNYTYSKAGVFQIKGTATDNSGATTTSNTLFLYDADGDKFASKIAGDIRGSDCDDSTATVHPGATEYPGDHKDSNCNGLDDF